MLTPSFAGELFGPGQALDASKYFIILPDTIGTGKSTKPSDGLRARFSGLRLRRSCALTIPPADGGARSPSPAAGDGQLHGRHGDVGVGRITIRASWTRWCRWPRRPARCRRATGCCGACWLRHWTIQSMTTATTPRSLRRCETRASCSSASLPTATRSAPGARGDRALGRQAGRCPPRRALFRGRQRLRLSVACVWRYNPPQCRPDRGSGAGDQLRRRRTQPAGDRRDRCGDEAREARQALSGPGLDSQTRGHLTTGNAKFYAPQLQELLQTAPQRTM